MASFICHVFGGTKRFRLERIVRTQTIRNRVSRARERTRSFVRSRSSRPKAQVPGRPPTNLPVRPHAATVFPAAGVEREDVCAPPENRETMLAAVATDQVRRGRCLANEGRIVACEKPSKGSYRPNT